MPSDGTENSGGASAKPARVALVSADTQDAVVASVFQIVRERGGLPLNMHRAVANAPVIFKAYFELAMAIRAAGHTTRADRELAILRTTYRACGDYEHALHIPMAKNAGLTPRQVQAISQVKPSSEFDDRQTAILNFVDEMTTADGVTEATFDALRQFYDDQAIVELTMTTAFYLMGVHVTHTLNVQPDAFKLESYGSQ